MKNRKKFGASRRVVVNLEGQMRLIMVTQNRSCTHFSKVAQVREPYPTDHPYHPPPSPLPLFDCFRNKSPVYSTFPLPLVTFIHPSQHFELHPLRAPSILPPTRPTCPWTKNLVFYTHLNPSLRTTEHSHVQLRASGPQLYAGRSLITTGRYSSLGSLCSPHLSSCVWVSSKQNSPLGRRLSLCT